MKNLETYKNSGDFVNALEQKDIDEIKPELAETQLIWVREWKSQGSTDEGTCCGGKGLEVWVVKPRGRKPEKMNIVKCSWVQGNMSASRSHESALLRLNEVLKPYGVKANYNDGWMDQLIYEGLKCPSSLSNKKQS